MADVLAGDMGLRQMLMFASYGHNLTAYARHRNEPPVTRLLDRAQAAGQVRADLKQTDLVLIIFMLADAAQFTRPVSPEL